MATINDNQIRTMMQRFGIVGQSPALLAAIRRAILVAPIDLSVLRADQVRNLSPRSSTRAAPANTRNTLP